MTALMDQLPLVIAAARDHLFCTDAQRLSVKASGPRAFTYRAPTSTGWILTGSVYMRNGEWTAGSYRAYGPKYDATAQMSLVEVAKLIRADLKAAAADPKHLLHGLTFSVRKTDYNALNVEVDGLTDAQLYQTVRDQFGHEEQQRTQLYRDVDAAVLQIVNAYSYDGSDIGADYWDVRFYGNCTLLDDWARKWNAEEKARKDARAARPGKCR